MSKRDIALFLGGVATGVGAALLLEKIKAAESSGDDQPIVMSGGSMYLFPTGSYQFVVQGADPNRVVHATLAGTPTDGRVVTQVQVTTSVGVFHPPTTGHSVQIDIEYQEPAPRTITIQSQQNHALRVQSPGIASYLDANGFLTIPDGSIQSVTVDNNPAFNINDGYCILILNYVGTDW
jgi:hypothetical protein